MRGVSMVAAAASATTTAAALMACGAWRGPERVPLILNLEVFMIIKVLAFVLIIVLFFAIWQFEKFLSRVEKDEREG